MATDITTKKSSRLGRGLETLIPSNDASNDDPQELPIDVLVPNPYQPRTTFNENAIGELEASIRTHGIIQPLLVRESPESGRYEIIAGERRWRAAQRAQLHNVPVIIRPIENEDAASLALIENIQREELTPLEEAAGFSRLINEFGKSQEDVAESVGKSRPYVANALRLLTLPQGVQNFIQTGDLTSGHARALVGLENATELAEEIISKGLNVRKTEALVKSQKNPQIDSDHKNSSPNAEQQDKRDHQIHDFETSAPAQDHAHQTDDDDFDDIENKTADLKSAVKNLTNLVEFENSEKDENTLEVESRLSDLTGMDVYFTFDMTNTGGVLSFKYDSLEQLDSLLIRFGIVQ